MKKTIVTLGLIVLVSACADRSELERLKIQNKELVSKNDSLERQIQKYNQEEIHFKPLPTLDKHKVSLGEELNLAVNLAWWYEEDHPTVVLKDELTGEYKDTLEFGKYNTNTKSIIAIKNGRHLIEGKILFFFNGQPKKEHFQIEYLVE